MTSVPSRREWATIFTDAGLPSSLVSKYADIFSSERIRLDLVADLTRNDLEDLGIIALGDQLAIKRQIEKTLKHASVQRQAHSRHYESDSDASEGSQYRRRGHRPRRRDMEYESRRCKFITYP